jgi:hypothetical protein
VARVIVSPTAKGDFETLIDAQGLPRDARSGSSSTCASGASTGPRRPRCEPRSGSRSPSAWWSLSSGNGSESSDLYTILQILSVYLFEKGSLSQVLTGSAYTPKDAHIHNPLPLLDVEPDTTACGYERISIHQQEGLRSRS